MKNVLLGDACVLTEIVTVHIREQFFHCSFHPHINRKSLNSVHTEKKCAVGNLFADTRNFHKLRSCIFIVKRETAVKTLPAGCILEYNPAAGQKVKEGRTIYLTINTIEVPLHIVPDVADNSSLRQAEARILASGFKLAEIQYIPGEKDWVYGVKYKGRQLSIGEKVPTGAVLTLMVGDGGALKADSLGVDAVGGTVEPVLSEDSAADESWF